MRWTDIATKVVHTEDLRQWMNNICGFCTHIMNHSITLQESPCVLLDTKKTDGMKVMWIVDDQQDRETNKYHEIVEERDIGS